MIPTLGPSLLLIQPSTSAPALARLLPAGSQLTATVMQVHSNASGIQLQLQLHPSGQRIELGVKQALPTGAGVVLSRDASGQLQLNPFPNTLLPQPPTPTAPAPTQIRSAASLDGVLRSSLPRQQSLGDVLNQLLQQTQPNPGPANQATRQLGPIMQSLLHMFGITPGQRNASQPLRRNVEKGGFFTEAQLSRGAIPSASAHSAPDLKASMGQLQQLADALPPQAREQMHKLLGDLMARVTTAQLHSASQSQDLPDGTSERHLVLDLPIRLGECLENVELRLKRHRARQGDNPASSHWLVRLSFDLQALGPLEAELRLADDTRLSARFWATEPDTAQLIEQRLPAFASNLNQQGILVDELDCHQGTAPRRDNGIRRQLINLKT
ncbi:flagellar hook-length control protein FliK [Marinobacterium rhizophilum]|uniref:flagellar hook-length control protein FliK n=1 Tax=Marinobacterium rhizophilum TaxID=420402 RepID=UPI0012EBAB64|nr:flagellar hook-length control protein FliK [Marinobacterium rhizophilum]